MAVSSGRCNIKKMTDAEEYFEVGEIFWYSPISEPDTCVIVKVVDSHSSFSSMAGRPCDLCDLSKWCRLLSNQVKMEDGSLQSFSPNCIPGNRSDGKDVYFKVI